MSIHSFARKTFTSGAWANPNQGDPSLPSLIVTALPGKTFRIQCDGANLDVVFDDTLTSPEETTLNDQYTAWSPIEEASSTVVTDKSAVTTATSAGDGNITLSGERTINGVLTSTSLVLLTDQTNGVENGPWVTDEGSWIRPLGFNANSNVESGLEFFVGGDQSTLYKEKFTLTTANPITVGKTPLTFVRFRRLEFGTAAGQAAEGNDSRLSDARTPTTHATSHANGSDDIQNATAAQKGLMTAAYASKLDGVEAGADVTDTANVGAAGAVMDDDFAAAEGFMRKTAAGAYEAIKSNLTATAAPGAGNDNTQGYKVGSIWIDETNDKAYTCLDASTGAAVWQDQGTSAQGAKGINWQGAWATSTAYVVDDAIENDGSSYICISDHTSGATDEPGVGASWTTFWNLLAAKGDVGATGADGANGKSLIEIGWAQHKSASSTYEVVRDLIFPGTTAYGTPTAAKIIGFVDPSTTGQVRLYDVTNKQIIAESATFVNETKAILDFGTLSNLPAGEAIFEIQVVRVSGSGSNGVYTRSFRITW